MSTQKYGPFGGIGLEFDDGVYDGVSKIIVGEDVTRVAYVKFEYVRDGNIVERNHGGQLHHGLPTRESALVLDYPDEYITYVSGRFSPCTIVGRKTHRLFNLRFKTSHGRSKMFSYCGPLGGSTKFELTRDGERIIGIHGRCTLVPNAIGVHIRATDFRIRKSVIEGCPIQELEAWDDNGATDIAWDDGDFDKVMAVSVGVDRKRISYLQLEYSRGGEAIIHSHGTRPGYANNTKKFLLSHDEDIVLIEGSYAIEVSLTSLRFKTSKGRYSDNFGEVAGHKFNIEAANGFKIVGFRGRLSKNGLVSAIGANASTIPPIEILEARGLDSGDKWDDGIHDDIRMVRIETGSVITSLKFYYNDGEGENHGKSSTLRKIETFELGQGECIIKVTAFFTKHLHANYAIGYLRFKTNTGREQILGCHPATYEGKSCVFEKKDHKFVGFYGRSSNLLNRIGMYVKPI